MPQIEKSNTNEAEIFRIVREKTLFLADNAFRQAEMSREISNRVLLKLASGIPDEDQVNTWVQSKFEREVEAYFAELNAFGTNYALKLTRNPENAEDIAQECVQELLSSTRQIDSIKGWLSRVIYHKAVKYISGKSKERKLRDMLREDSEQSPELLKELEGETHGTRTGYLTISLDKDAALLDPSTRNFHRCIKPELAKKLLKPADYAIFMGLREAKNLRDYAVVKGIKYQTAKEHKQRVLVNLRSAYMKMQGWLSSPEILDYRQLSVVKRFIRQMMDSFGDPSGEGRKSSLGVDKAKVFEALQGFSVLLEWNIKLLPDGSFSLVIVSLQNDMPVVVTMKIRINRAGRINVLSCKRGETIAIIPEQDRSLFTGPKHNQKLDKEQTLALIPGAKVLNKEQFEDFVKSLKE